MTLTTILEFHTASDLKIGFTENFGKLEITVDDCAMPVNTWDVKFDIDCSGSMEDICKDSKTKMQHIQHTMINILRMFSECTTCKYNVSVSTFDNVYNLLFDFSEINATNVDEFIEKIKQIYSKNSTNLILPIKKTNTEMQNRKTAFPTNKQLHILLTDGCDTCNNNVYPELEKIITTEYDFIAFGFGKEHDVKALTIMGKNSNCQYGFIDELENAGLVYGEYLHTVLYRLINNITITLEDGEIYDWKTNTWSSTLSIPGLDSGVSKTFYVRTNDKETITGIISGCLESDETNTIKTIDDFEPLPDLIVYEGDTFYPEIVNLTTHAYRYKTLDLMFRSQHTQSNCEDIAMKTEIRGLFEEIKKYIEQNNLQDDLFMKKIQDDVFILYKTYNTPYFELYASARQRSQGNQNVCTATQMDDTNVYNNPIMMRSTHAFAFHNITQCDAPDDDLNYTIADNSQFERSCSATVSKMMRSISKK